MKKDVVFHGEKLILDVETLLKNSLMLPDGFFCICLLFCKNLAMVLLCFVFGKSRL